MPPTTRWLLRSSTRFSMAAARAAPVSTRPSSNCGRAVPRRIGCWTTAAIWTNCCRSVCANSARTARTTACRARRCSTRSPCGNRPMQWCASGKGSAASACCMRCATMPCCSWRSASASAACRPTTTWSMALPGHCRARRPRRWCSGCARNTPLRWWTNSRTPTTASGRSSRVCSGLSTLPPARPSRRTMMRISTTLPAPRRRACSP